MQNTKYVLGVMTCKKNLHKADEQFKKYLQDISKYPIIYIKFIGDATIDTEYIYDKDNNLLTLKCEDDYVNLPNKVYTFFKTVVKMFPDVTNIIKMDEDVIVDLPKLFDLMERCKDREYAGRYIGINSTTSGWLAQKEDVCKEFPDLAKTQVYLHAMQYCAGCIYFLNRSSVDIIINSPEYFPPFPKNDYKTYIKTMNGSQLFVDLHVFEDYNIGRVLFQNNVPITQIRSQLMTAAFWDGI
jgi:hypothetical protein